MALDEGGCAGPHARINLCYITNDFCFSGSQQGSCQQFVPQSHKPCLNAKTNGFISFSRAFQLCTLSQQHDASQQYGGLESSSTISS